MRLVCVSSCGDPLVIKPHLGDDPNQLISIFLDSRAASCSIIEIDGILPSHFFSIIFFFFDGFIFRWHTEILIAEVFANNEQRKKKPTRMERRRTEGKKDPAPLRANFIRNRRFSLFRRLTLLLGLLCVFTSFPPIVLYYVYAKDPPSKSKAIRLNRQNNRAFDVSKEISVRPHTNAAQWTEIKKVNIL